MKMGKIKILMVLMFVMVLSSLSVFGLTGSGTELNPYLISSCSDFDSININFDFNNKLYMELTKNINCSNNTNRELINETINGFIFNGNDFEINNIDSVSLFGYVNVSSNCEFNNLVINDSSLTSLIILVEIENKNISFNNISIINSNLNRVYIRDTDYYYGDKFSRSHYGYAVFINQILSYGTENNINLNNIKLEFYKYDSYIFNNIEGDIKSLNVNINKMFHNIEVFSGLGYYSSFLNGLSSNGVYNNININELEFIKYTGDNYFLAYFMFISDSMTNLIINNSIFNNNELKEYSSTTEYFLRRPTITEDFNISNTILLGNFSILYDNSNSNINNENFNNVYYWDINNISIYGYNESSGWSGYSNNSLYGTSIYSGWDTDIFYFEDGQKPALEWYQVETTPALSIECYNLDYEIYEFSNLSTSINCITNDLFVNYTIFNNSYFVNSDNLTIEKTTYDIDEDIYNLSVCVSSSQCENFNINITNRITDDIKPNCESLPTLTEIYEEQNFSIYVNCSDKYTNLTLNFYSFPANISNNIITNFSNYSNNVTLLSPSFDFTLYLNVSDSRGNYNIYSKFYTTKTPPIEINETLKINAGDYSTSETLIYLGLLFFSIVMFLIGLVFDIPILPLLSGILTLFMGVLFIPYYLLGGVIIIIFGLMKLLIGFVKLNQM